MDALITAGFSNFIFTLFDAMLLFVEGCCYWIEWLSIVTKGNVFLFVLVSVCLTVYIIESLTKKRKRKK